MEEFELSYELKLRGTSWRFYVNETTGYARVRMVQSDKERTHLTGVDLESCLQYCWAYYNDRNIKKITVDDLTKITKKD